MLPPSRGCCGGRNSSGGRGGIRRSRRVRAFSSTSIRFIRARGMADRIKSSVVGWRLRDSVPWTVSWSGEERFDIVESEDFPGLVDLVQVDRAGEGVPRFKALHVTRLRAGMARHICHVCGRPTPRNDRYLLPVQSGGFVSAGEDPFRYAANVPPLHLACTRTAQRLCPHLRQATIPPIAYPSEESRLLPRRDVVEGMEALAKTLPPGLPVVFSCFRLFGPRFSRKILKLRQDHSEHSFTR